jgi:hypothetical protein
MEGHGLLISVHPAPHSDAVDTGDPAKNKKNRGPGVSPEAAPFKPLQFRRADRLAASIRPALPASDDRQLPLRRAISLARRYAANCSMA